MDKRKGDERKDEKKFDEVKNRIEVEMERKEKEKGVRRLVLV